MNVAKTRGKLTARSLRDAYMELIHQFPLRKIRTEAERDAAGSVLEKLAVRESELAEDESDYLDVLADLVEAYDAREWAMPDEKRTPVQRLLYLLEQSGTTAKELAKLLDCSPALVSLLLAGKRELSKANVLILSRHFKIDAAHLL